MSEFRKQAYMGLVNHRIWGGVKWERHVEENPVVTRVVVLYALVGLSWNYTAINEDKAEQWFQSFRHGSTSTAGSDRWGGPTLPWAQGRYKALLKCHWNLLKSLLVLEGNLLNHC